MIATPNPTPDCPPPQATHERIAFDVPTGACDTHAHVIGPYDIFPLHADRSYTPPEASSEAYFAMLEALGMQRGVLVQISVHGTDNRAMVRVLERHPDRLRGIAVIDETASDAEISALHQAGVRGVRANIAFRGGIGLDATVRIARRIAPFGWHVQLLVDVASLPDIEAVVERLGVDVVFDHMGHTPVDRAAEQAGFQGLVRLLRARKAWVKLSGAYRVSSDARWRDTVALARGLVDAAPERCLWGSDWPHVALKPPMPNTGALLNLLHDWVPDPETRRRILVDNPAKLYGFDS
jgi:2-pyrone-4,6-dicarboxylate lactonase